MLTGRETIVCPICLKTIYTHTTEPIKAKTQVDSRTSMVDQSAILTLLALEVHDTKREMIEAARKAARDHFNAEHRLRVRVWKKFKWAWVMAGKYPWTKTSTPTLR